MGAGFEHISYQFLRMMSMNLPFQHQITSTTSDENVDAPLATDSLNGMKLFSFQKSPD